MTSVPRDRLLLILDVLVAVALVGWTAWAGTAGGISAARVAVLVVGAATVAIRRISPGLACGVAIAALGASQGVDRSRTAPVVLALVLDFYCLGQHCGTWRRGAVAGCLLSITLLILVLGPQGDSAFYVLTSSFFACVLPFVGGRAIAHHEAVAGSLLARTSRLARDQKEQISRATGLERARIARELHDVIAHNVSVMVIQAVAARRIASSDRQRAAVALDTVEMCGRDAMREMRSLVGVLHRADLDPPTVPTGSIADLGNLADRAKAAGLTITVSVEGEPCELPAGLELTARRVIQEALTNAILHAAPANAAVTISYSETHLELDVYNSGRSVDTDAPARLPSGGRGLIGMRERVAACRGELTAGKLADGGFRVHARLPLEPEPLSASQRPDPVAEPQLRPRTRWFDLTLAALLFAACEAQVLTSPQHIGSRVVDTAIVAGLTAPLEARRRTPVAAAILSVAFLTLIAVTPLNANSPDAALFMLFIPPYSIGAYATGRQAFMGMAVYVTAWVTLALVTMVGPAAWAIESTVIMIAAWITGRVIANKRRAADNLARAAAAISSEVADVARLAVADERTRIARRLQTAVARSVADMIIQTHAARTLLESDNSAADAAMAEIDVTGRRALEEMRAILGVLRLNETQPELAPQPGIGQLPALVDSVRTGGCAIELRVDGEPRPIPALADLGVYRIAEEALLMLANGSRRRQASGSLTVTFDEARIALQVCTQSVLRAQWPTPMMIERAALNRGTIECDGEHEGPISLRLEMPTDMEEVFL